LNSSPQRPWAFAASFDTYSNQQNLPLGNVMASILRVGVSAMGRTARGRIDSAAKKTCDSLQAPGIAGTITP
jgi:hypothetical protein